MNDPQGQVPENHPMMKAWARYKDTNDYENTIKWAKHPQHVEGALWSAFVKGFKSGEASFEGVPDENPQP